MEELSKGMVVFEATTHIKRYGKWWLESRWCAKGSPKTLLIDNAVAVKKELSYNICLKRYRGCVRCSCDEEGTIECTVTGGISWPGTRRTWCSLLSTFQGNAYGTRRFRKSIAWPKVVSNGHCWTMQLQSRKCERRVRACRMACSIIHTVMFYSL